MSNNMEIPGVNELHERTHFLHRAIHHKQYETEEEKAEWEQEIKENDVKARKMTREFMDNFYEELKQKVPEIKKEVKFDGDLKREIARLIIRALEPAMSVEELKGVFRQGYKIMRTK